MAIVTTDSKHYSDIADAIREKTGEATTYKPEEIPAGVGEVYEAGKQDGIQSEYDRFWDEYQANGKKDNYRCAFNGYGWTAKNFYPKYDIKGTNAGYQTFMFFNCAGTSYKEPLNLSQRLKDCGVTFDSSTSVYMENTFYGAAITTIPEVSTIGCKGSLVQTFYGEYIETIEKLILRDDGVQSFYNTFNNATSLKNIIIEGKIGKNGFNVSWSPLTHDSLMSIINALQDKSEDTSGTVWAVTLGTANLAKLTDAEKAIATQRGWTLA